ncbi:MAG: VCBS repeat-containing protein [Vicinamibacteria bacterium]|nr:VCBS repeat-containing protein [Vicinamibacteria bacterium]
MQRQRLIVLFSMIAGLGLMVEQRVSRLQAAVKPAQSLSLEDDARIDEQRRTQCQKCHVVPPPEFVPRGMWRFRIREMAERSMMGTGVPPGDESLLWQLDLDKLTTWYETRAPEVLPLPEPWPADDGGLRFTKHVYNPPGAAPVPVVSNVRFFDLDGDGKLEIVVCDMGRGSVFVADPARSPGVLAQIAVSLNPSHAEMVDLDKDGKQDLLIADLGEFLPADHERGSVIWLRQTAPFHFEKHVLIENIPRSSDVQAADFDGDGDLDLVVAAFGWHRVGGTFYYENQTVDWKEPKFDRYTIDARPGAIHAPPVDLNKNGRMDFVALVSQQYEHVVAYLSRGPGRGFRAETIFRGPSPVYGSSGIQVLDMDGDGDFDVLYTNGDSLDDFTIRPFHGIRWLENKDEFPFVRHDLAAMPGVHRAQAADMDGDGDLDVMACAFLPAQEHPFFENLERQGDLGSLTSVGWIERVRPDKRRLHALEKGRLTHTTLDLGDFDGDGDMDMVLGNFVGFTFGKTDTGFESDAWVELWENQARRPR